MNQEEKLSRHAFLKSLGLGGAALMAVYMSSCVNETGVNPSGNGALTIDLTLAENAVLAKTGGYIIQNNIVIANIGNGNYAAVTRTCSHEGQKQVIYQNGEFYCPVHGARYSTSGKGLNSTGNKGIASYSVALNGNILTVG